MRREIEKSFDKYTNTILGENEKANPKRFFSFINKLRLKSSRIPLLKVNGKVLESTEAKVEALSNQYKTVFTTEPEGSTDDLLPHTEPNTRVMKPLTTTQEGVRRLLAKVDPSKAQGPDKVLTRVLKEAADEVSPMLTKIFNQSYKTAKVPDDWRKANVHAIYKKGSTTDPANYRPVSLTSVCCKLFEHIIHSSIMKYLQTNQTLVHYQHGFRAGHSCESQLISTIEDLAKSIDEKTQTDVVVLDFAKAFDTVPHQ